MYMISRFIVEKMEVVREVDDTKFMFDDPRTVPQFDKESLPFVVFNIYGKGVGLLNIKTCARPQLLVQANILKPGFFISSGQDSFDFHFAHVVKDDAFTEHEQHHRLSWTQVIVDYLKKYG